MGTTDFSPSDIRDIVEQIGKDYRGDHYHLLNKNCNQFSAAVTEVSSDMHYRRNKNRNDVQPGLRVRFFRLNESVTNDIIHEISTDLVPD